MARKYAINSRTKVSGEPPSQRSWPSTLTARALTREGADDLREHPDVAAKALAQRCDARFRRRRRRARRACAERAAQEHDRVLQRGSRLPSRRCTAARSSSSDGAASRAGKSCSNARRISRRRFADDALQRRLDVAELVARARAAARSRRAISIDDMRNTSSSKPSGEQRPGAPPQVPGERSRVGAKDAEDEIHERHRAPRRVGRLAQRCSQRARRSGASETARGT